MNFSYREVARTTPKRILTKNDCLRIRYRRSYFLIYGIVNTVEMKKMKVKMERNNDEKNS